MMTTLPTNLVAGCMGQEDDGAELKDARVTGEKDTHSWEVRNGRFLPTIYNFYKNDSENSRR
jgi:hypothetical protein